MDDYDITCLWAACCTGSFVFLHSGEFTCNSWAAYNLSMLSLSDVMIDSRSTPSVVQLTLRQSKTDAFGAGVLIYLGRTGNTLCPVSALLAYLAMHPPTPEPLFLLKSSDPLSREALGSAVRLTLSSAGLDICLFNGHSFQIGLQQLLCKLVSQTHSSSSWVDGIHQHLQCIFAPQCRVWLLPPVTCSSDCYLL